MVSPILPPGVPYGFGMFDLEMLAIRDGSELLLYGDNTNIWKYSVAENKWEVIANLLMNHDRPLVIKVRNIFCP